MKPDKEFWSKRWKLQWIRWIANGTCAHILWKAAKNVRILWLMSSVTTDLGPPEMFLLSKLIFIISTFIKRIYVLRWWGQEYPRVKKLDDLLPANVTVTISGKIALPEFIKKITIDISSFKIKFQGLPFFTWAVTSYSRCSTEQIVWL